MARASRRFARPGRGFRRGTDWVRGVPTAYTTVGTSSKVLIATIVLANPGITETIIRTRGLVSVQTDTAAAEQVVIGAFGMIVVNDLAIAAGVASIPGPVTDDEDDGWFVWVPFSHSQTVAGATSTSAISKEFHFDSKAARRVEQGFGIALVVENASAVDAFEMSCIVSQLAKVNT